MSQRTALCDVLEVKKAHDTHAHSIIEAISHTCVLCVGRSMRVVASLGETSTRALRWKGRPRGLLSACKHKKRVDKCCARSVKRCVCEAASRTCACTINDGQQRQHQRADATHCYTATRLSAMPLSSQTGGACRAGTRTRKGRPRRSEDNREASMPWTDRATQPHKRAAHGNPTNQHAFAAMSMHACTSSLSTRAILAWNLTLARSRMNPFVCP